MRIELRIDNYDQLPDGGPVTFVAEGRTFEIGRDAYRDWTLPDDDRYISGRHCEVQFENGQYYLVDVSRNGTYLNGASHRMKDRYLLGDGDRVQIGPYVVAVSLSAGEDYERQAPSASAFSSGGLWDFGGPTPAAVDRRDFMPKRERQARNADRDHIDLPVYREPKPAPPVRGTDSQESPFARAEPHETSPLGPSEPDEAFSGSPFDAREHAEAPRNRPRDSHPIEPAYAPPPPPVVQPSPDRGAVARSQTPPPPANSSFVEALALAAGIEPSAFHGRSGAELGTEIGTVLREVSEELSGLLRARAAAKAMARAERTMISAENNNPLKILPTASDALQIMFARNRPGYLGARDSFRQAFTDLKSHEMATYAAMQKALSKLLEGLSPDAIEARAGGSVLGSRKSRAWDIFVERWDAKSEPYENGMLDVFLAHFAEAYNAAARSAQDREK